MRKKGMAYDDVAKRVKRIQASRYGHPQAKVNLIRSLKNQCRLAEGESAINELERECAMINEDSAFSGAGNKQLGACLKFDCVNRNRLCNACLRGSAYSTSKTLVGSASALNAEKG